MSQNWKYDPAEGARQKLLGGFFSVQGGGSTPQFRYRFVRRMIFRLGGGPPNSAKENSAKAKKQVFQVQKLYSLPFFKHV